MWMDRKAAVLAYWDRCNGSREGPLDPQGAYIPTKTLGERGKGKKRYKVAWLGYAESTWEPREALEENHSYLLDEWDGRAEAELGELGGK